MTTRGCADVIPFPPVTVILCTDATVVAEGVEITVALPFFPETVPKNRAEQIKNSNKHFYTAVR